MGQLSHQVICGICGGSCEQLFPVKIQNRLEAFLYKCLICEFMFYPDQDWIKESFSEKLNSLDVGSVDRVLFVSEFLTELIFAQKLTNETFVDFGGGYGLQTRVLRDRGFNFKNYDPYVVPIFCLDFQAKFDERFKLLSLIEVCLHFEDPIYEFRKLIQIADYLFFTTVIHDSSFGPNSNNITGESGQHIAFYSVKTLEEIADQLGVKLYSDGKFFHIFYQGKLSLRAKFLFRSRIIVFGLASIRFTIRYFLRGIGKQKSFIADDQEIAKSKLI